MNSIADLITHHDDVVHPNSSIGDAARLMLGKRLSSVIVVEREEICGIVTESDMLHAMREHRALELPVAQIMTAPVHSVSAATDLRDAYRSAARLGIRHIVVTGTQGRPLGVASESDFRRHLGPDFYRHLNSVDLLMDRLFPRLRPEASLDEALAAMESAHASSVIICDGRKPLGVLTERDVVRLFVEDGEARSVGEVMTRPALCIAEDASLASATEIMNQRGVRHLVVTNTDGCAVGLLSEHSLMRPLELDLVDDVLSEHRQNNRRADEALLLRNAALAGLVRGEALSGVLDLIVLSVEAEVPDWRCSIMIYDAPGNCLRIGAAPRLPEAYLAAIDRAPVAEGVGTCGAAAFRRERVISESTATDPLWQDYRDLAELGGFSACWSEPILGPKGELLGTFAAYHASPATPNDSQSNLLTQASQLSALILSHQHGNDRLNESRDTFRGIFDNVSEALIVIDEQGVFLDFNRQAESLSGHPGTTMTGARYSDFGAEGLNDHADIDARIRAAFAGYPQLFEYWALSAQGRVFPVEVRLHATQYFGRRAVIASILDISERKLSELQLRVEHDLASTLAADMPRETMLTNILHAALRYPELDAGALYLREPDGRYSLATHTGLSEQLLQQMQQYDTDTPLARIIEQGQLQCACTHRQDCCSDQPPINEAIVSPAYRQDGLAALVILPIMLDSRCIGFLMLASRRAQQISPATQQALDALRDNFSQALQRQAIQEKNAQLQANLGALFDSLSDFIFVLESDGTIIQCNRSASEALGTRAEHMSKRSLFDLLPDNRKEYRRALQEMIAGRRHEVTLILLASDGAPLTLELRSAAGHWNDKAVLFCIGQDIGARLAAEERQKLAASVFENAHEGIMITDAKGCIVEVNSTFSELTGYSRSEALGRGAELLNSGHHDAAFYRNMWDTISQAGYWRGEIWNRKKSGEIFVELLTISTVRNRAGEISHYVGIFSDITLIKQHQQRLEQLAHYDALTQLPNRMLLGDRLQLAMAQSLRSNKLLAVCYLDLDGFKPVNDQYGHAIGDRLLVEVAQRLKRCIRAGDTVSRLGGDEFVLLFSELNDIHECDHALNRVVLTLAEPFQISGHRLTISASIGATLHPLDSSDADALLRHADQAMYIAKQAGRNRYHLFDPENDRRARARREEITRLRQALNNHELRLYYQPKVDMRHGNVLGVEALIRWQHPERGLLLPNEFLPAADDSELAIELGEWVMREALRQLTLWTRNDLDLSVSVNIAGSHLQHPEFAARLGQLLAEYPDIRPQQLELEVLETAALEDISKVAGLFATCREYGVSFALDDFGTGYSSLTYFRRLPAAALKIDQSFVRDMLDDPEDLAIVEGVIGLTQAFDRQVIAEGVETVEHGLILLLLGCDLAQGFGIARPMPGEQLADWIAQFRPDPLWSSATTFRWAREDFPMLIAEIDHQRWMRSLHDVLSGQDDALPLRQRSQRECGFGRWYYGPGQKRYGALTPFIELEACHRELHDIALRTLDLAAAGRTEEAQTMLAHADTHSERLIELLRHVQAEILLADQTRQR